MMGAFSVAILAFVFANREPAHESRPLNAWLRDLGADEPHRRTRAEAALRRMGVTVLPALLARLESSHTKDQARAVLGFAALGDQAHPALPQLIELLRNDATTLSAARALAAIGPAGVPLLTNALASPFRPVRTSCARALGRLRGDGRPAVPALVSVLNDDDDDLRYFATRALGNLAVEPVQAVPALMTRLEERAGVRGKACGLPLNATHPTSSGLGMRCRRLAVAPSEDGKQNAKGFTFASFRSGSSPGNQ